MAKVVKKIIFAYINTQSYAELQFHSECLSQARKGTVLLHNLVTSPFHHIMTGAPCPGAARTDCRMSRRPSFRDNNNNETIKSTKYERTYSQTARTVSQH